MNYLTYSFFLKPTAATTATSATTATVAIEVSPVFGEVVPPLPPLVSPTTNATGESLENVAVIVPFPAFTPDTVSFSHFVPS